jgi:hypothetical protein
MIFILLALNNSFGDAITNIGHDPQAGRFTDVASIISKLLTYAFPAGGLVLFFFLASGGFDLMTSAGDPKKIEQGKEKITSALVGFIILFAAYWIYLIVAYILGIKI